MLFQKKKEEDGTVREKRAEDLAQTEKIIEHETKQKITIERYRDLVFRLIRQYGLIIGIIILLVVGGLIVRAVYFKPKPPVVIPPAVDRPGDDFAITTASSALLSSGVAQIYDVVAVVQNRDPAWGVAKLSYVFILKDANGQEVTRRAGTSYILPEEEKSIVEVGIATDRTASSVAVELDPMQVQRFKKFPRPDVLVSNANHAISDGVSRLTATITNNSPYGYDIVDVTAVIFNQKNEPVGVNRTVVNSLFPKSARDVLFRWNRAFASFEVSRMEVSPHVNLFQVSNFMNVYQEGTPLEY